MRLLLCISVLLIKEWLSILRVKTEYPGLVWRWRKLGRLCDFLVSLLIQTHVIQPHRQTPILAMKLYNPLLLSHRPPLQLIPFPLQHGIFFFYLPQLYQLFLIIFLHNFPLPPIKLSLFSQHHTFRILLNFLINVLVCLNRIFQLLTQLFHDPWKGSQKWHFTLLLVCHVKHVNVLHFAEDVVF